MRPGQRDSVTMVLDSRIPLTAAGADSRGEREVQVGVWFHPLFAQYVGPVTDNPYDNPDNPIWIELGGKHKKRLCPNDFKRERVFFMFYNFPFLVWGDSNWIGGFHSKERHLHERLNWKSSRQ